MGLLANPVTLNDGVGDRIFGFRSQEPDTKSIVGVYSETAAALSAESILTVKHDQSNIPDTCSSVVFIWFRPQALSF